MTIYLIRHGKTAANEARLYCGSSDLPLSEQGVRELQRLPYPQPDAAFATSGMLRTEQTLALLFGQRPHRVIPEFREVDFGRFELRSYEQLKNDPEYLRWITGDNEANVPPEGESGAQMTARVLAAWQCLVLAGEDLVLITHGGVIAAIMAHLFPEEEKNRYEWQPAPGHGWRLTKTDAWTYAPLP